MEKNAWLEILHTWTEVSEGEEKSGAYTEVLSE